MQKRYCIVAKIDKTHIVSNSQSNAVTPNIHLGALFPHLARSYYLSDFG